MAISSVAIADVLFKKAAQTGSFWQTITNPLAIIGIALYLFQIFFFIHLFVKKSSLIDISVYTIFFYAFITVSSGVLLFNEKLSLAQAMGIIVTLFGVYLVQAR
jgi:drug/metabolite transporter (DMT)-like permease